MCYLITGYSVHVLSDYRLVKMCYLITGYSIHVLSNYRL